MAQGREFKQELKSEISESKERKILEARAADDQSTHIPISERSAGKIIITLAKKYLPQDEKNRINVSELKYDPEQDQKAKEIHAAKINKFYEDCLKEINEFAQENDRDAISAIQLLNRRANEEFVPAWDTITIWNIEEKQDVTYALPLKIVLPIVWAAIKDDAAFEKFNKDVNERKKELLAYIKELQAMESPSRRICHTGGRHGILSSLNGRHKDVNLLDDPYLEIIKFLRTNIPNLFLTKIKTLPEDRKNKLRITFFDWINKKISIEKFLQILDDERELYANLGKLFLQHGCNPDAIVIKEDKIEKKVNLNVLIDTSLNAMELDLSQNGELQELIKLFAHKKSKDQELVNELEKIQMWVRDDYEFGNSYHAELIKNYNYLYEAYNQLIKFKDKLIPKKMDSAQFESLRAQFKNFFVTKKLDVSILDNAKLILQQVTDIVKTEKFEDEIANFFAKFFGEEQDKKLIYAFFANTQNHKRIMVTDPELDEWLKDKEDDVVMTSGFRINKILLHALIVPVEEWSDNFKLGLDEAIHFIKTLPDESKANDDKPNDNFGIPRWRAKDVRKRSYPKKLLDQINYLRELSKLPADADKELMPPRPVWMLLLPPGTLQAKEWTGGDWAFLRDFAYPAEYNQAFINNKLYAFKLFNSELKKNPSHYNFELIMKLIPQTVRKEFWNYIIDNLNVPILANFLNYSPMDIATVLLPLMEPSEQLILQKIFEKSQEYKPQDVLDLNKETLEQFLINAFLLTKLEIPEVLIGSCNYFQLQELITNVVKYNFNHPTGDELFANANPNQLREVLTSISSLKILFYLLATISNADTKKQVLSLVNVKFATKEHFKFFFKTLDEYVGGDQNKKTAILNAINNSTPLFSKINSNVAAGPSPIAEILKMINTVADKDYRLWMRHQCWRIHDFLFMISTNYWQGFNDIHSLSDAFVYCMRDPKDISKMERFLNVMHAVQYAFIEHEFDTRASSIAIEIIDAMIKLKDKLTETSLHPRLNDLLTLDVLSDAECLKELLDYCETLIKIPDHPLKAELSYLQTNLEKFANLLYPEWSNVCDEEKFIDVLLVKVGKLLELRKHFSSTEVLKDEFNRIDKNRNNLQQAKSDDETYFALEDLENQFVNLAELFADKKYVSKYFKFSISFFKLSPLEEMQKLIKEINQLIADRAKIQEFLPSKSHQHSL